MIPLSGLNDGRVRGEDDDRASRLLETGARRAAVVSASQQVWR